MQKYSFRIKSLISNSMYMIIFCTKCITQYYYKYRWIKQIWQSRPIHIKHFGWRWRRKWSFMLKFSKSFHNFLIFWKIDFLSPKSRILNHVHTVKLLFRGPSREQPPSHNRPVNLALYGHFTCKLPSFERSPLLKGHFSVAFGVDSQRRFYCI